MTLKVEDVSGPVSPQDVQVVHKPWGYERWCINSPLYCGKELFFFNGRSCSFHYHRVKDETFLVASGLIRIRWIMPTVSLKFLKWFASADPSVQLVTHWWMDDSILKQPQVMGATPEEVLYRSSALRTLSPGDIFHVPVGMIHQMTGLGDSKMIEFSTHHEDSDSYRLIPGG